MKKIAALTLLGIVLSPVSATANSEPDSITVTGRFVGIAPEGRHSVIINECDICDKSVRRFVEFDSSGYFSEKIPFYYGHTFTIVYDRSFINAYAEPSDSIHIEADVSCSPFEFHISGDRATLNEEFSHAYRDLSIIYYDVSLPSPKTPFVDYMPAFKDVVNAKQSLVDSYVAEHGISDDTAELLRKENVYSIANQAIDYVGENRSDEFAFFTDSIFDVYNEDHARVMIFPYHLSTLCRRFPEVIEKTPKGLIRDLMYAIVSERTVSSRSDFYNTAYYDRIFSKEQKVIDLSRTGSGNILAYRDGKVEAFGNENPVEWLKTQYSGKPIYLDISAVWCGPCRASLAQSEDIRAHFAGSDVVFAVLWLKSDRKNWSEFVPSVSNAVHIFVEKDEMSDAIMGAFNLRGFPAGYLINRDGSIVSDDVPRLHDPALYDYLKKAAGE